LTFSSVCYFPIGLKFWFKGKREEGKKKKNVEGRVEGKRERGE
jgi:hypothetical protein